MREVRGCTTIFAGRIATTDGSVMSTHSNDGEGATDPRLVRVPPANHPSGALRPVYFSPESYPRYVGVSRGVRAYAPLANQSAFQPIGHIPQVCSASRYLITDFPPPDLIRGLPPPHPCKHTHAIKNERSAKFGIVEQHILHDHISIWFVVFVHIPCRCRTRLAILSRRTERLTIDRQVSHTSFAHKSRTSLLHTHVSRHIGTLRNLCHTSHFVYMRADDK